MLRKSSSILIVDCNGIGDIIINLSLYAAIRDLYPLATITLLGPPWAEALLRHTGLIDFYVSVKVPWGHGGVKYLSFSLVKAFFSAWKQRGRNQMGIELSGDCRNKFLLWLSRSSRRVGLSYANITAGPMSDIIPLRYLPGDRLLTTSISVHNNRTHILNQRSLCIDYLGHKNNLSPPQIKVTQQELSKAHISISHHHKTVLVHPGAGSPLRYWPAKNYLELVKELRGRQYYPVLIAAPGEKKLIEDIVNLMSNSAIPILYPSLRDLLALIAVAKCIVCMDSAAAHIAGNIGTPAIVLYGCQSRAIWHPVGGPAALLRNDVCSKHPCKGQKCPHGLPAPCMSSITPAQVLNAFDYLMHENQNESYGNFAIANNGS